MHIDWWTLGLQTIDVLVLIWLLKRFLLQPVAAMIEARQAASTRLLDEAETARKEAIAERDKAAAEANRLAAARNDALNAASAEAEAARSALLADARTEAERLRTAATAEIERMRQNETAVYADHAGSLAVDIATKLFGRLPEEARIAGFIDGLAEAVSALPQESRALLGAEGVPLQIRAARALNEAETATCRAKLGDALGRPVEIVIAVDPGLIAGLEIDTPYGHIRNSFRADLDRIALELTRHDHDRQ